MPIYSYNKKCLCAELCLVLCINAIKIPINYMYIRQECVNIQTYGAIGPFIAVLQSCDNPFIILLSFYC